MACEARTMDHLAVETVSEHRAKGVVTTTNALKKGLDTPRIRSCSYESGTMDGGSR